MQEIKRGDIWWVSMPEGKGSEQIFTRPCFVIQNDIGNQFSPTVTILPLTKQNKKWMPTHSTLHKATHLPFLSMVLAEQITTVSKERFLGYIESVDHSEIATIENAILIQLGIVSINNVAYAN